MADHQTNLDKGDNKRTDYDTTDYTRISRKSRKRKRNAKRQFIIWTGGIVVLVVFVAVLSRIADSRQDIPAERKVEESGVEETVPETETMLTIESTLSPEEQERQRILQEKQAVVDSYANLGLVQVAGYLNVRETPGSN